MHSSLRRLWPACRRPLASLDCGDSHTRQRRWEERALLRLTIAAIARLALACGSAGARTIPRSRCASSCRTRPAAAPTRWRAGSPRGWSRGSASRSWSRTAPAPARRSARASSPARRPTATPSCSAPARPTRSRSSLYKKLPYDPAKDFAPIALVAEVPFVLVVHPSLPVHSVAELVALAKANPGAELRVRRRRLAASRQCRAVHARMTGIDITQRAAIAAAGRRCRTWSPAMSR